MGGVGGKEGGEVGGENADGKIMCTLSKGVGGEGWASFTLPCPSCPFCSCTPRNTHTQTHTHTLRPPPLPTCPPPPPPPTCPQAVSAKALQEEQAGHAITRKMLAAREAQLQV